MVGLDTAPLGLVASIRLKKRPAGFILPNMATWNSPLKFFSLFLKYRRKPWPDWVPSEYGERPPAVVPHGQARATFINHATVLIQTDNCNILTDPIWSYRCSPFSWAGPRRHRNPGLRFEDLPRIDVVLISHNHYDHMDLPTLRRLQATFQPRIITGFGNGSYLNNRGIRMVEELEWWDPATTTAACPKFTFVPAKHFSGRGLFDRNKTRWGGFTIETSSGCIFFAGDTGYGPHFREIAERFGQIDLSLLPIGAYEPRSFMCPVHMNPAEAVQAHLDLKSAQSMGIHFGTFRLAFEGMDDPANDLIRAREAAGITADDFEAPQHGSRHTIEWPLAPSITSLA